MDRRQRLIELFGVLSACSCAVIAGLEEKTFTPPSSSAGSAGQSQVPGGMGGSAGAMQTGGEPASAGADPTDGGSQNGGDGGSVGMPSAGTAGVETSGGMSGASAGTGAGGDSGTAGAEEWPPSCAQAASGTSMDCGPSNDEDCCASPFVEGGEFDRLNDDLYPFSVSSFRLDRFEVTVARFRPFARAVSDGWRPTPGSGRHAHLDGGSAPGELGWLAAYDELLSQSVESCPNDNYTASPGAADRQPVVCASYYHAFAFCVWDGGYLPSSTELLYVMASGSDDTRFPWGNELDPSRAVYASSAPADVGSKPLGEGRWGHLDIVGNAWEMVADNKFELHGCNRDCSYFDEAWHAFAFGGSFESSASTITGGVKRDMYDRAGDDETGFRCARAP